MIENRAYPRHRILKQGTIAFRGGGGIDCMVRNISQGGARLEVASPVGLPGSFTLVIANDDFMRDCHTVWHKDRRVGVAFE
ncbi:MAG: PilZ domain-containing protein [Rhizobiales bacterium]|nr:PilZ domain-containing protein [Hyphomicrobiales bacterium]